MLFRPLWEHARIPNTGSDYVPVVFQNSGELEGTQGSSWALANLNQTPVMQVKSAYPLDSW